jgi:adenylate kinase family enzyme
MPIDKNIRIIIAGAPSTGKTTLAVYIGKILRMSGLDVSIVPDPRDMPDSGIELTEKRLADRIESIRNAKRQVIIEQRMVRKNGTIYDQ